MRRRERNLKKKSPSKDSPDQVQWHAPVCTSASGLAIGARNEHAHAAGLGLLPHLHTPVHGIVFSPRKRKSLPFTDREPLINTGRCTLQVSAYWQIDIRFGSLARLSTTIERSGHPPQSNINDVPEDLDNSLKERHGVCETHVHAILRCNSSECRWDLDESIKRSASDRLGD